MPYIDRLTVYPVKACSPQDRERVTVTEDGPLAGDREYVLLGPDGDLVNGKRTARVHDLSTHLVGRVLSIETDEGTRYRFDLDTEREAAESFFSEFFDLPVEIRHTPEGTPDRSGTISVVSTATLREVAHWFEDVTVDGLRRRLRANVEVAGVEPFWEDRFVGELAPNMQVVGEGGTADSLAHGDASVRVEGVEHCGRCVVPTRDPQTGDPTPNFRERFVERRRATYPNWIDADGMPHDYTLMLIAQVPDPDRGGSIAVGDEVRIA